MTEFRRLKSILLFYVARKTTESSENKNWHILFQECILRGADLNFAYDA